MAVTIKQPVRFLVKVLAEDEAPFSTMGLTDLELMGVPEREADFTDTCWNVVRAAGRRDSPQSDAALAQLCRLYWYPLYVFVRRSGHGPEDAQDLTQEFFARLMEKSYLEAANPEKGKFRSFLLVALKRFLANEWDRAHRNKRGGGRQVLSLSEGDTEFRYRTEPADPMTPEKAYERRWAMTVLDEVLVRLEAELVAAGKRRTFEELKQFLLDEETDSSYAEIAARLKMTEGTLRVTIHRLRHRCRELLREEISQTVTGPGQVDEEIQSLFASLSGG